MEGENLYQYINLLVCHLLGSPGVVRPKWLVCVPLVAVLNLSHMGLSLNHTLSYRRGEVFSHRDLEAESSGFSSLQEDMASLHFPCLGQEKSMRTALCLISGTVTNRGEVLKAPSDMIPDKLLTSLTSAGWS